MPVAVVQVGDSACVHAFVHYYVLAPDVVAANRKLVYFHFAEHVKYLDVEHLVSLLDECEHSL